MKHLLAMLFGALIAAAILQLGDTPSPESPSAPTQDDVTPLLIPDTQPDSGPICTPVMDRLRLMGCPVLIV